VAERWRRAARERSHPPPDEPRPIDPVDLEEEEKTGGRRAAPQSVMKGKSYFAGLTSTPHFWSPQARVSMPPSMA
jgi:hypothetical protein